MWPHCDINAIFAEKEGEIATIFCESELNCKLLLRIAVWLVDLLLCLFCPIVGHSECLPCLFLQKVKHKTWSFLGYSRLPQFIVYIVQKLQPKFTLQVILHATPTPTPYHNAQNKCFLTVQSYWCSVHIKSSVTFRFGNLYRGSLYFLSFYISIIYFLSRCGSECQHILISFISVLIKGSFNQYRSTEETFKFYVERYMFTST